MIVGPLLLIALSFAGCGGGSSPIPDENKAALIKGLREYVPSTSAYDDEYLLTVSENVCQLGRDDGARILDNYSRLAASEYDAFVTVVFGIDGCPESEDN